MEDLKRESGREWERERSMDLSSGGAVVSDDWVHCGSQTKVPTLTLTERAAASAWPIAYKHCLLRPIRECTCANAGSFFRLQAR